MYFQMEKSTRNQHKLSNPMKSLIDKVDIADIVYDLSKNHWKHLNGQVISLMEDYIPKSNSNIAIIGCGIFGALSALELAKKGNKVTIFEAHKKILNGASLNNQNRLHLDIIIHEVMKQRSNV